MLPELDQHLEEVPHRPLPTVRLASVARGGERSCGQGPKRGADPVGHLLLRDLDD